ncbi:MAG: hypothetical protein K8F91_08030 [Candidatus Obscuribacterales bacterium]|nr:hypothetical protein [Candidatus Obscuribacterales bacterium]
MKNRRIGLIAFLLTAILVFVMPLMLAQDAFAQGKTCSCKYETDSVQGEFYFVLRGESTTAITVLVLSKSSKESTYLTQLQADQGYEIIGTFKSFEAAKFMALAECPNCK